MASMNNMKQQPRVIVSEKRHKKLTAESKKRKMDIKDVAEEKFEIAEDREM